jgi:hypothetical protein
MNKHNTKEPTGAGDESYAVGYRKPPLHSRFRAGQSGNPAGRRKGVRNLETDVKRTPEHPDQGQRGWPDAEEIDPGRRPDGVA